MARWRPKHKTACLSNFIFPKVFRMGEGTELPVQNTVSCELQTFCGHRNAARLPSFSAYSESGFARQGSLKNIMATAQF